MSRELSRRCQLQFSSYYNYILGKNRSMSPPESGVTCDDFAKMIRELLEVPIIIVERIKMPRRVELSFSKI
jgi:hypothetical protein